MNNEEWYGQTVETQSDPLVDEGKGKPVAIRTFEFQVNPECQQLPPKQELFNAHWPQIRTQLWKDGLVAIESVSPKLHFDKKTAKYYIVLACEAKFNNVVMENPATLQDILKKT